MRYVGDMFFFLLVCFCHVYILHIRFSTHHKKRGKKKDKKNIDAMDLRRVRVLPWMRVGVRI